MWSPTKYTYAGKGPVIQRMRMLTLCLTLFAVIPLMQGCGGYRLSGDEPSVFGSPDSTIRIREVENPSLYAWVGSVVRAEMRDEITNRNMATWRDSGRTDYSIAVVVDKITISGRATDTDDTNRLFSASVIMKAAVYDENTNTVIWDSGFTSVSETFRTFTGTDQQAAYSAVRKATQYIVDRMRHSF
ncbi:LPS assembly lipoprotein LptE [Oleidesulfovibrio sp.]|uniref:LPS assembly lipoprotein LptE n=1 Tax=Oleidesulfovibrio sp. TaxID=2909707 RepID=UPI003A89FD45